MYNTTATSKVCRKYKTIAFTQQKCISCETVTLNISVKYFKNVIDIVKSVFL